MDIVKEAFRRMKKPIRIKVMPWARALFLIQSGTADAIFTIFKNAEREKFADYSKEILMPQVVSMFVQKGSQIVYDGELSKLARYSFGAVRKVSYGGSFDKAVKDKVLTDIQLVNKGEQNFMKLAYGRVDIVVSNRDGALFILKEINKANLVRELTPVLQNVPSYIAFSKKRKLSVIRDKFDVIIKQMKKDGSYEKIVESWTLNR